MRTIGARINLKPVLESAFKYESMEIHEGNTITFLLKKSATHLTNKSTVASVKVMWLF